MDHREKSINNPANYMCIILDGMNQKKMCLHHLKHLCKDVNDDCLVQMHEVGCLAYNGSVKPHVFVTYPNVHNGTNVGVTTIQKVLMSWGQSLPPVLYIELDNIARELACSIQHQRDIYVGHTMTKTTETRW